MSELSPYHELDPDGDLILVFRDPPEQDKKVSVGDDEAPGEESAEGGTLAEPAENTTGPANPAESTTTADEPFTGQPASTSQRESEVTPSGPTVEPRQIRVRVSSKHLTLASKVFKALLRPGFQEGDTFRKNGTAEVPLPEDDPNAFLLLLDIVHCRTKRLPSSLPSEQLSRVAGLVDKYALQDATEVFTGGWFQRQRPPLDAAPDLALWVSLSWVLRRPVEFKRFTAMAMAEGTGPFRAESLPLPSKIIGKSLLLTLTYHGRGSSG